MSLELEVKILDIDRLTCENRLHQLGATKTFDGTIITQFYDYPDYRIQKKQDLIRLRILNNQAYITYKKYISNQLVKRREEAETQVTDFQTMHTILLNLGLDMTLKIKKHRTSYTIDKTHFEFDKHLDKYSYIPEFIEIEAPSKKTLYKFIKKLNLTNHLIKPWTFFDLKKYYSI